MTEDKYKCCDCLDVCEIEPEEIHYSGTHCTNGNSGIHKTGFYLSTCCQADYIVDYEDEEL